MRRITAIAVLPTAALVLAACGASDDTTTEPEPAATLTTAESPTTDTTTDATSEPTDTGSDDDAAALAEDVLFGTPADVGGPYGELRDGVWAVGVAGEVEFRVTGTDSLELVDVRAEDGWEVTEEEVDEDSIDVDFLQGPVEYELQVEIEDGILEIEIDQDITETRSGTFAVGEAATVGITAEVGALTLGDVTLADGWSEVEREVDNDDIELDFQRAGDGFTELWELNADRGSDTLDVEVDYEIEGRFAG